MSTASKSHISFYNKSAWYIIGLLISLFIVLSNATSHVSMDAWFMVRHGEDIINNGFFATTDFLSVHNDIGFVHQKWLMCILSYVIYSFGGFRGLYLASLLFTAALTITIYVVANKFNPDDKYCNILFCTVVNFLINSQSSLRPQTVACLLIVLEIFVLEKYVERKFKSWQLCLSLCLISIGIMWFHSTLWMFCIVPILPYLFDLNAFTAVLNKIPLGLFRRIESAEYGKKPLVLGSILMLVCGMLQPNGIHQFEYLYNVATANMDDGYAALEMQSPYLYMANRFSEGTFNIDVVTLLAMAAVVLYVLFFIIFSKGKLQLRYLYFVAGCIILHIHSIRLNLYVLPMICVIFAAIKRDNRLGDRIKSTLGQLTPLVSIFIAAMFFISVPISIRRFYSEESEKQFVIDGFSLHGVEAIRTVHSDFSDLNVFAMNNIGSYIHLLGGHSYTDCRQEVYDDRINKTRNVLKEQLAYYEIFCTSDDFATVKDSLNELQSTYDFDYYIVDKLDYPVLYDVIQTIGYFNYEDDSIVVFSLTDDTVFEYDAASWVDDTIMKI